MISQSLNFFRNRKGFIFFALWFSLLFGAFNFFAYEINQANAALRLFVKTGTWEIRRFDDQGLPISTSARVGEFISPFYVVHYGLAYSEGLGAKGLQWRSDPSMEYWNKPPEEHSQETNINYFKNSADWVIKNITFHKGQAHLLYDFDWPYSNYPNEGLSAPWWSGLTDGYAIILLLRAYDYFGDLKYYKMAESLYESVLTPVNQGGSTLTLNGCDWIEEYVDPELANKDMSFVLNGMVYATYGIEAFESNFIDSDGNKKSPSLYRCIEKNIRIFDLGGWSYYDGIGNPANIKYHFINYAIFLDMVNLEKISGAELEKAYESWKLGFDNPGIFYTIYGPVSIAYYHFIFTFLVFLFAPLVLIKVFYKIKCH